MYKITVKSDTRSAEYTVETIGSGAELRCEPMKRISKEFCRSEHNAAHAETVTVRIMKDLSTLELVWVVLWGSIDEVICAVETVMPMAKLEVNVLFDAFAEDEGKQICYTYPLVGKLSKIFKRTDSFRVLGALQGKIVADLWGKDPDEVRVLEPEFS